VGTPEEVPELESGTAGASARRTYERRRANREARIRRKRFGALRLAVRAAPRHEEAWLLGAEGEEEVARRLAKHLRGSTHLLHDRRMPRSRANIDHIAVAASGVWVIDAKRYTGKVSVSKPLLGEAMLMVGGRNRSRLADGLERQVHAVESAMSELRTDLPVHGAFCLVGAEGLPTLGTLTFRGYPLLSPRRLAGRIKKAGSAEPALLRAVAVHLSSCFPPA
jgi:Nuclease-related domain